MTVSLSLPPSTHPAIPLALSDQDLRQSRPDLGPRQRWEAFRLAVCEQDRRVGVTEEVLVHAAEVLFGPACTRGGSDSEFPVSTGRSC